MSNTLNPKKFDIIGILSSSICLIHCLATPLLMAIGAGFFTNPWFEHLFVLISFLSIYKATQKSNHFKLSVFLWISFAGFAACIFFEEWHHDIHYVGYFFSLLIIIGHLLNIKHCQKCTNNITND